MENDNLFRERLQTHRTVLTGRALQPARVFRLHAAAGGSLSESEAAEKEEEEDEQGQAAKRAQSAAASGREARRRARREAPDARGRPTRREQRCRRVARRDPAGATRRRGCG
jgi:hypothetical protein